MSYHTDMRYFQTDSNMLTVGHNSETPGLNPDRAIYIGLSGYGKRGSMALSIDNTIELVAALRELLDAAAPEALYVVDTTFGAYSTRARSKAEALQRGREWAEKDDGRVSNRVWKVVT